MNTLIADPRHHVADRVDPALMAGTDPYSMWFCVCDYYNNGVSEVASYALGDGMTAYVSFSLRQGFALVVRDLYERELFASRMASEAEIRTALIDYVS
ncbi:hypothetical protein ASG92_25010 [Arthrobacter sp. Soil736]|uniref:hypothetical protein n=1 Tax=Arthrobacter sp. Soil736 TaxID=1736395 RepID=UPI000700BA21|nr:hypothetical protein [Arthrobacter sp. Soil736]KRE52933.1 hypothetical protein ASG92_25010 [Arthrobacter sp. Soil736]